jgi:hypothetical protein
MVYKGVSKRFRTESITKYTLTKINTHWEATQSVMAAKLTRLTHEIAIQLHLIAESCTICSSRSRRPVRKLLVTPSYVYANVYTHFFSFQLCFLYLQKYFRGINICTSWSARVCALMWVLGRWRNCELTYCSRCQNNNTKHLFHLRSLETSSWWWKFIYSCVKI